MSIQGVTEAIKVHPATDHASRIRAQHKNQKSVSEEKELKAERLEKKKVKLAEKKESKKVKQVESKQNKDLKRLKKEKRKAKKKKKIHSKKKVNKKQSGEEISISLEGPKGKTKVEKVFVSTEKTTARRHRKINQNLNLWKKDLKVNYTDKKKAQKTSKIKKAKKGKRFFFKPFMKKDKREEVKKQKAQKTSKVKAKKAHLNKKQQKAKGKERDGGNRYERKSRSGKKRTRVGIRKRLARQDKNVVKVQNSN